MKYVIELNDQQEKFLDIYLAVCPLRAEHTRQDYPGLIANNFINSMMKRQHEFEERLKHITYQKESQ